MRHYLTSIAILLCICSAPALAAEGQQASYQMTITPPSKLKIPPIVYGGTTTWSGGRSRSEMKDSMGKVATVQLTDLSRRWVYVIEVGSKTAWKSDFQTNAVIASLGALNTCHGGASMLVDYPTVFKQLEGMEGVTVTALPAKQVNGYNCHGLSYTIDLIKLRDRMRSEDQASRAQKNSGVKPADSATGQMWFSVKHKVIIKVLTKMDGMSTLVMEFTDVKPWSGPDSTFSVPPGYAVKDASQRVAKGPKQAPKAPGRADFRSAMPCLL
jgi:hypothetical protein